MKKILLLLILSYIYTVANSSILIINSYHKGYTFSDKIISGIEESLYSHSNIDINILYMDSKRITSKEYFSSLKKLYSIQLKKRKYDLIIALDRFAYDFVLENYNEIFLDKAILAVGLENFSPLKLKKLKIKKVSSLLEKRDLIGGVSLIEKLIPKLKKLYIINDKSENAKHTQPLIKELINAHKKEYRFIYIQEDDLESLNKKFSKEKEEGSAILFIRFYKNVNGKLNKNQEISSFIKNSKIPVFVTDSIFYKKGATGGKIIDLKKMGKTSARMALEILEKDKHEIKVFNEFDYVFDAKKLEEFILPISILSSKYTIVNKRETFYDKHRGFINFIFTISPVLIFLILGLIHNIYKRKVVEKDLRLRMEFDTVLVNAIDSPLFWQNEDFEIIDANNEFCELIGVLKNEIIGSSLEALKENKNVEALLVIINKCELKNNSILEFKVLDKNLEQKTYLVKQTPYKEKNSKQGMVTLFTDITKEKAIVNEKQKNKQFVIQQSKLAEIGEVFSSIAHQWKSPLVEITAIAQELFYSKKIKVENEDDSFVSDIMTQVNYMTKTINDFQTFIMPSNKKTTFNIEEAIKDILKIINHNIKYNNVKIDINIKEDSSLYINGYKNEFMQSILNIIINAKDELLKNDYKNRNISIDIFNENKFLVITILDNAGGIDMNNLEKIFKPYYSTKKEGHGIGLYMSKMIIEDKMNGKLSVLNVNDGAQFKIEVEKNK